MFPILYEKNETNFLHNGIGVLSDCISATATEERNGIFELEIEYDSDGQFADVIENDMIIKAKANDKQDPQLFRIYTVNKSQENDNLKISAQHITYDLAGNFVEKLELNNVTAAAAMEAIQNNLAYPTKFTIASTNTATVSSTKLYRTNPLQMIGGIDGSIIDNWGGEIERDNFRLILHAHRGSDNGVLVAYKKNLTGLEAKFDTSEVVTRIFPFKVLEDGTVITIPGKFIDSPLINNYPFIRILPIDASEDEDVTDQASLYAAYKNYFNSGAHDKPTVTLEVEFEPLWATEEYEDVAALELIGMGDTITVRNEKMGVDVTAEATKIEYDVLNEKNAKVTAGSIQTRLTDAVNGATSTVAQGIQQATQTANAALTAANGKNKIFYGPDEPAGANKDDVWFKVVDGEYTRTYRFDGIQWQLVVDADVSAADQAAQAAQAAAEEAKATAANAEAVGQTAQQVAQQAAQVGDSAAKTAAAAQQAANAAQTDAANAVSKNDVINQINVSTEGILIDGKKVHITGQTAIDNAVIKDAMIDSVSANKLTAGTIDANVINVKNINASNIVTGTLDASKATVTNIDASKITTGTLNAARIAAGSIDASKLAAGTITAASGVIGSLDASKITTGTLDASRVSVVNLDASNIKTGTLSAVGIHQSNTGQDIWLDTNGFHAQMGDLNVWMSASHGFEVLYGSKSIMKVSGNGIFPHVELIGYMSNQEDTQIMDQNNNWVDATEYMESPCQNAISPETVSSQTIKGR
ncbi:phage tail spike protein [Heyndrickxia coagulans]|uniref:phage tail spike protein n=1 Tax=Heyndrickxia coagulans TaxID=1398 RepID=UPI0013783909|nr:phage tail spike protein [Heyndrickxia coagulans]